MQTFDQKNVNRVGEGCWVWGQISYDGILLLRDPVLWNGLIFHRHTSDEGILDFLL